MCFPATFLVIHIYLETPVLENGLDDGNNLLVSGDLFYFKKKEPVIQNVAGRCEAYKNFAGYLLLLKSIVYKLS